MKIENVRFQIDYRRRGTWLEALSGPLADRVSSGIYPLRLCIVDVPGNHAVIGLIGTLVALGTLV